MPPVPLGPGQDQRQATPSGDAQTVAPKTLTAGERVQRDPMANTEGSSCYEDWKRAASEQLDQIRVSALDDHGRTVWTVDAHGYGKRFVVHADEKLTAFVELERAIRS